MGIFIVIINNLIYYSNSNTNKQIDLLFNPRNKLYNLFKETSSLSGIFKVILIIKKRNRKKKNYNQLKKKYNEY